MQFSRQVTEAASRVLQESYPKGINLNDFQKLRQFRTALCQITGQNPNLAYKLETIRELIKLNGWLNGNKVIPYSTSSDSVEKKAPSQSAPLPVQSDAVKELERYRNDYCVWFVKRYGNSFESYWQILKTIVNEASKNGIVDKTLDLGDLKRIKNDLFALPKYDPKYFSARESYLLALDSFINFWTDVFAKEESPKVEANDVADASDDEQEPEKPEVDPEIKAMLLKDFEARRDEYYQWFVDRYSDSFNDYWQKLEKVVDDAIELGILDDFLDADALEKIQTELFALPQYECKPFSSKWIYPRALKRFAQFWNDKATHDVSPNLDNEPNRPTLNMTKNFVGYTEGQIVEENGAIGKSPQLKSPPSLEKHKEDFMQWLANHGHAENERKLYWASFVSLVNELLKRGTINESTGVGDITQESVNLVKRYLKQCCKNQDDITSQLDTQVRAVSFFIAYLIDKTNEEDANKEKKDKRGEEIDNSAEILYQFDKGVRMEFTRPSCVEIGNGKRLESNSWAEIYYWIVGELYRHFPNPLLDVLQDNLRKGVIADFLDERLYNELKGKYPHRLKYIAENFYLNTNHGATTIISKISRWLDICGIDKSSVKIYYSRTQNQGKDPSLLKEERKNQSYQAAKFDYNAISKKATVANAIRQHFPNGFRFDDSSLSLLSSALGEQVDSRTLSTVRSEMFGRKDGVYFFSDFVIDRDSENELFELVNKFTELNSGFEVTFLYDKYRDHLNASCVRDVDDFEDWIGAMSPVEELKFMSIGKMRIARLKEYRTDDEFVDVLLQKIRNAANRNYGTLEENDIIEAFDGFSLVCLSYLIKRKADDLFVKEINDTVCFQTFEGLGIPEDFSENIRNALDKTDELDLTPSLEVLNALLAVDLGYNPRNMYGIEEDKSFRKLIEVCYKGVVARKWKANVFGKDDA